MAQRSARTVAALVLIAGCLWFLWPYLGEHSARPSPEAPPTVASASVGKAAPPPTSHEKTPSLQPPPPGLDPFARPLPQPSAYPRSTTDRYAGLPVIAQRETPPADQPRTRWQVTKLVRDASFKYPVLRVTEDWQAGKTQPLRIKQSAMVGDHVMLKLQPGARIDDVLVTLAALHPKVRKYMPASKSYLVAFDNPTLDTVPEALDQLRRTSKLISSADPDHIAHALNTPNDTSYSSLWGMHNTGQSGGVADVDIDAPEAWDVATGSRNVLIGVIDTGLNHTHPDLAANVWVNPHEIPGNNLDDDSNGYIDDIRGWDFYNNDNNPADDNGHGTHVAGTLGAAGNNAAGVTGVCWQVSIAALKFLNASGNGSTSDALEAVSYATSIGVLLTSNSWGGGGYEQIFADAIAEANASGMLFIAAAGNEQNDNDTSAAFPSCYDAPNIISVAAITRSGGLSWFSSYGANSVDVGAPGSDIYSTLSNGGYTSMSGTSMATPHVSGLCALLKSYKPALTASEIKAIVLGSARPLASLAGKCATGGLINARAALDTANDLALSPGDVFAASAGIGGTVTPATRTYTLINRGNVSHNWTSSTTQSWLTLSPASGTLTPDQSITVTATLSPATSSLPLGISNAAFTITNTATSLALTRQVSVEISQALVHNDTLDFDPGWTLEGQWQLGQPLGNGGTEHGYPDPTTGATGTNVIGMNNGGDYYPVAAGPWYATSPVIDLSHHQDTKLRFQSWLNCDYIPWCSVAVQISTDGINWTSLLSNDDAEVIEAAWSRYEVDISAVADGSDHVQVRFGYQTTEGVYPYSGWNVDDIQILGTPVQRLALSLASYQTQEGAGPISGTVSVIPTPLTPVTITLSLTNDPQATLSTTSIVIPGGASSAPFTITPTNDALLDGTQSVILSATATTYQSASTALIIDDNETSTFTVSLPPNLLEGSTSSAATVSLPAPVDTNVTVNLASSDTSQLTVPTSIIIFAGNTSRSFALTTNDDAKIDGTKLVTITASVPNWTSGSASMDVLDNESTALVVELLPSFSENQGTVASGGVLTLGGSLDTDLAVSLSSSLPAHLTVPASIVVPAGFTQVVFPVTLIDDPGITGQLTASLTAQAAGFTDGNASTLIYDLQSVAVAAQPAPAHLAGHVSPESDLSWTILPASGLQPDSYDVYLGTTPALGAGEFQGNTTTPAWPLARLARGTTYYWKIISTKGTDTATSPTWQFTVPGIGALDHFAWSTLPTPVQAGQTFTATITARDEFDDIVTTHSGAVTLTTQSGGAPILITELDYNATDAVEFTNVSHQSIDMSGWQIVLYDEMSWPAPAFTVTIATGTAAPGQMITLREGSGTNSFPSLYLQQFLYWTQSGRIGVMLKDATGTIIDFVCVGAPASQISSPVPVPASAWTGVPISASGSTGQTFVRVTEEDTQSINDWDLASMSGIGVINTGLVLPFPGAGNPLPVSPSTATLTNGTWTEALHVGKAHPRIRLLAADGSHEGMSNLIAVTSVGSLILSQASTQGTEGSGAITNAITITLPAISATDVTITLTSDDTTELASDSAVIIAGQTSVSMPLIVVDDNDLDGSKITSFEVSAVGYDSASGSFSTHDNEVATLSVSLPASASESDASTPLTGTVSLSSTAQSEISVALGSSLSSEASVPATVIIPNGSTQASFVITIHDDDYVDGTQTAVITPAVANWPATSGSIQVLDNEPHTLALNAPFQLTEGAGTQTSAGTLTLAGRAPQNLVFNLVADEPTQLSAPATVTVPAGASTASFDLTAIDDSLTDGTHAVTLTVSAASFSNGTRSLNVLDNDVHHFTQSTIASPQTEGAPFAWTIEARDVNDALLVSVAGPVTISLTSNAPLPAFTPAMAGVFGGGVWPGQMRVLSPATNVHLTITSPTASLQSNAFDVGMGPRISVSPASLTADVLRGRSVTQTLTIQNTGTGTLNWSAQGILASTATSTPEFAGVQSDAVYVPAALPSTTETDSLGDHAALSAVLSGFDASHASITRLIPARHDFTEGASGSYIADGGSGMFFFGNQLATNLTPSAERIDYSDGSIVSSASFGAGGQYFTRKQPGLFVLAADVNNLAWFETDGGLGPPSSGTVDGATFTTMRSGKTWRVFARRVALAGSPSVNHLFIVRDAGARNHEFAEDSAMDEHRLTGITGIKRLYYLMFGSANGRQMSNDELRAIAEAFLDIADGGTWISAAPAIGSTSSSTITSVTLNAATLPAGTASGQLSLLSNDELHTPLHVPVTLNVIESVPVMTAEPAFTGGTSNTVSWSAIAAPNMEYEVHSDITNDFTTPWSSGWITATSVTRTELSHGTTYLFRVRSRVAGDALWTSEWSPAVISQQDNLGPALIFALPSGGFTSLGTYVLTGSASDSAGTGGITFTPTTGSSTSATSGNQFYTWSVSLPRIELGDNAFTVTATDLAVPSNSSTVNWSITRIDPSLPPTSNGVSPLLATSMNVDASAANAPDLTTPDSSTWSDAGDGKSYLTFTFRRRILVSGFTYLVETSDDLSTWNSTSGDVVIMTTTPTGDGVTELCTCRITPALAESERKFVRLSVTID